MHHDQPDHQLAHLHDQHHDHDEDRQREHEAQALHAAGLIAVEAAEPAQPQPAIAEAHQKVGGQHQADQHHHPGPTCSDRGASHQRPHIRIKELGVRSQNRRAWDTQTF